jgi:hypothetical protein
MPIINEFGMPFTNVGGDRLYSADDWREYFKMIVASGVVSDYENDLEVKQQTVANKSVQILTGAVSIQGTKRITDSALTLNVADNTSGSTRIDRIVARLNIPDRKIEFVVKQGTTVAPTLTRTDTVYELSLAKLTLANGYSSITDGIITDERQNTNVCGYAKTVGQIKFEQENNFGQYDKSVITTDATGNPTEVQYKRDDNTLAIKQVASNPDVNNYYQTVAESFYKSDGIAIYKTITYTLTFLANGIIATSSKVVS